MRIFDTKEMLSTKVSEEDIEEMFSYADKDNDGKLSYLEFKDMINPPKPPAESIAATPVKRVTIKTTEKEEELVDIIDTNHLDTAPNTI